jgi:hypothetical protein
MRLIRHRGLWVSGHVDGGHGGCCPWRKAGGLPFVNGGRHAKQGSEGSDGHSQSSLQKLARQRATKFRLCRSSEGCVSPSREILCAA